MDNIKINITGDLFLGRRVEPIAQTNPGSLFDNHIIALFANSNLNIINLESPLTDAGKEYKIVKTGPHLKAAPGTIQALTVIQAHLVTLGNNHIYDYGDKGLCDTLELCTRNQIDTVGAGLSLESARRISYKTFGHTAVAIVNFTENEWGNASEKRGGANPMNLIANSKSIAEARAHADCVIVIVHGGHEYYKYPSPRMVEQYRYYVDQGASAVIGHHSHCISGCEVYKNAPILYGLGNFLFDPKGPQKNATRGMLVQIRINERNGIEWEVIPYKQCEGNIKVERLNSEEQKEFEREIRAINSIISDPEALDSQFHCFVNEQAKHVLAMFSTSYVFGNKYIRSIIRKLGAERFFIRNDQLKSVLNYTQCEAHRDITSNVLLNHLRKYEISYSSSRREL